MDNENFFDFPIPLALFRDFINKIKVDGWELDEKWLGNQSVDFYKGMYAGLRAARSICVSKEISQELSDMFDHVQVDILWLIGTKEDS